jgi:hypothetical protein
MSRLICLTRIPAREYEGGEVPQISVIEPMDADMQREIGSAAVHE